MAYLRKRKWSRIFSKDSVSVWAKHLAKFNKDWYEFDMWAVIMNFFTPRLWQWKHKNICLLVAYTQKLYCAEWQQRIVKNVRREKLSVGILDNLGHLFHWLTQMIIYEEKNQRNVQPWTDKYFFEKDVFSFLYIIYYFKWDTICFSGNWNTTTSQE